jgi:transcriptional regulator with XRE-family HTH domain
MTGDNKRRRELHDFLQEARKGLEPADIGLAAGPNRRGTGLRQADVAAAMGVSVRWYNGLENGSARRVPGQLLDDLARLLRLSPPDRVRLYLLATAREPAHAPAGAPARVPSSRAALERLVHLASPGLPALLCDEAWNIACWNEALADRVFDPARLPDAERNYVTWLFSEDAEDAVGGLSEAREEAIGQLHLARARRPGDPHLDALTARLQQIPAARRVWTRLHSPGPPSAAPLRIRSRSLGAESAADLVTAEFRGGMRLLVLVPRGERPPGSAPARRRLPREHPAPGASPHGGPECAAVGGEATGPSESRPGRATGRGRDNAGRTAS